MADRRSPNLKQLLADVRAISDVGAPAKWLDGESPEVRTRAADDAAGPPRWGLVIAEEGEFPTVRAWHDVGELVDRLQALAGREVSAWAFYGTALPLTVPAPDGTRYLLLPDGERLLPIPPHPACAHRGPEELADVLAEFGTESLEDILQQHSWLGDPALLESGDAYFHEQEDAFDDEAEDDGDGLPQGT